MVLNSDEATDGFRLNNTQVNKSYRAGKCFPTVRYYKTVMYIH